MKDDRVLDFNEISISPRDAHRESYMDYNDSPPTLSISQDPYNNLQ